MSVLTFKHKCLNLTQAPPNLDEEQSEEDVTPVPLMFSCYGNDTQEEENECFWHSAKHFDNMTNSCAWALGHVFLHVVLHGQGTGHNAVNIRIQSSGEDIHR